MDLVDRIETTRFLGSEFLTWLWYKIELFGGALDLGEQGVAELIIDNQVNLASWVDEKEKVALRGATPSTSPEASEALRNAKVPQRVALRLTLNSEEFVLAFNGPKFSMSGVKLPQVLPEDSEERFHERMRLLELLDNVIGALYDEYLLLRLSPLWAEELAPAMREWVKGHEALSTRAYGGMLKRAITARAENSKKRPR